MNRKLDSAFRHWLRSEQQGLDRQADEALLGVFARLPVESVPVGFADRVMARAGLAPVPTSSPAWAASWAMRLAISLCLLLAAMSLWVIPGYLPSLLGLFNLASATEVGVSALVGVFHQLGSGLVIWRILTAAGSILSSTLSSPLYLAALFSAMLLSLGAFRMLHEIVVSERSSRYVGSV